MVKKVSLGKRRCVLFFLLPLLLLAVGFWACGIRTYDDAPPASESTAKPPSQRAYEVFGRQYRPIDSADGFREQGVASWYGVPFHGRKTSSGEVYNMHAKTAAHPSLPMGTFLLVRNLENNKKVIVRINDRGPFAKDRIIDLSYRSAQMIDMIQNGTTKVEITALDLDSPEVQERVKTAHPDYFTGDFTVQAGSFSDKNRAEALRDHLQISEPDVFITRSSVDGQTVYRVRVGRFTSLEDAHDARRRLVQNGHENVFAVSMDQ